MVAALTPAAVNPATIPAVAPRPIAVDAFSPLSNLSAILTNAVAPPTPRL